MWIVNIIESEAGWGSRIDDQMKFETFEEAKTYQTNFNSENVETTVPDWYMYADNPFKVKD